MDQSKIYIKRNGNFMSVGVEGNAHSLRDRIKDYKTKGKFKDADFSPILIGISVNEDFLVVNIYGDRFCTLTALQNYKEKPNTSLVCSGISNLPLEFLVDLSEALSLNPENPSAGFIREVDASQLPLLALYQKTLSQFCDKALSSGFISQALMIQQEKYREDSRRVGARYS